MVGLDTFSLMNSDSDLEEPIEKPLARRVFNHRYKRMPLGPPQSETKEFNYLNFVKKMQKSSSQRTASAVRISLAAQSLTTTGAEQNQQQPKPKSRNEQLVETKKHPTTMVPENEIESEKGLIDVLRFEQKSMLSYESYKTEKVVNCMHDEIILCECCRHPKSPATPVVSMVQFEVSSRQPLGDIFHLTNANEADEDQKNKFYFKILNEKSDVTFDKETTQTVDDDNDEKTCEEQYQEQPGLRELLISNYDARLADRIGVSDFLPIEVISRNNDGKNLKFIPFEAIDNNYTK